MNTRTFQTSMKINLLALITDNWGTDSTYGHILLTVGVIPEELVQHGVVRKTTTA